MIHLAIEERGEAYARRLFTSDLVDRVRRSGSTLMIIDQRWGLA